MNHAQIDHLLQVTATRPESFAGAARSRDNAPPFDNHFREASAVGKSTGASNAGDSPGAASSAAGAVAATPNSSAGYSESDQRLAKSVDADSSTATPANAAAGDDSLDSQAAEEAGDAPADESDENPEVAALLAAAQAAESATVASATVGATVNATGGEANGDGEKSAQQSADGAATQSSQRIPGDATSNTPIPEDATDAAGGKTSDSRAESDSNVITAEQATATEAAKQIESGTQGPIVEGDVTAKSDSRKDRDGQPQTGDAAGTTADPAVSSAAAKLDAPDQVTSSAHAALAGDRSEAPSKSDKKSTARSDTSTRDAASRPVERPATAPRATETTTAPVVANIQQSQAADTTSAASETTAAAKSAGNTGEAKAGILTSLGRLDRGAAHGSRGALRPGQSESTPHVDPARFISRVARAVQTAHERGGPLQLRLSPPELGAMRIELSVNQGALVATVETDNQVAKQVLLDNLPVLRDRLAEQNIKVERFDVDVRRDSTGGGQQNNAPQDRDASPRHNSAANQSSARRQAATSTLDEPHSVRRVISNTSINVVA